MLGANLFFAFNQEFPILCSALPYLDDLSPDSSLYSTILEFSSEFLEGHKDRLKWWSFSSLHPGFYLPCSSLSSSIHKYTKTWAQGLGKWKLWNSHQNVGETTPKSILGYVAKWKEFPSCSSCYDFMIHSKAIKDLFSSST